MGHLGTSVPGFCTEFRYLSYGQSGLAWGAIFEKIIKIQENALFEKMDMSKRSRNVMVPEKKRNKENGGKKKNKYKNAGGPMQETQPEAFKNTDLRPSKKQQLQRIILDLRPNKKQPPEKVTRVSL